MVRSEVIQASIVLKMEMSCRLTGCTVRQEPQLEADRRLSERQMPELEVLIRMPESSEMRQRL